MVCEIITSFHALSSCNFTQLFEDRSKYDGFKTMSKKQIIVNKITSLSTNNLDYESITELVLRVMCNRPNHAFIRKFSDTKRSLPDVESLQMKILRANYVTLGKMSLSKNSLLPNLY